MSTVPSQELTEADGTITVRFFAAAKHAMGTPETRLNADTLRLLVERLTDGAPDETRTIFARSSFLVNAVARTDHDAPLHPGDTIDVLPPFAGG